MRKFYRLLLLLPACLMLAAQPVFAEKGSFQQVDTKTLSKQKFTFPDDLSAGRLNIVLLAMSEDQDNGTWQGDVLLEWYAALETREVLNDDVKAWHFSALKVPFFVKSIIRNGMADQYKGKLPLDQSAPLYVKNLAAFAKQAGVPLDDQPNIILVGADGVQLQQFKGEATDENVAAVVAAISEYLASTAE